LKDEIEINQFFFLKKNESILTFKTGNFGYVIEANLIRKKPQNPKNRIKKIRKHVKEKKKK
jgi:hypothetical protein